MKKPDLDRNPSRLLGTALPLAGFLLASAGSLLLGGGGILLLEATVRSKDAVIEQAFLRDAEVVDLILASAQVSSAHRSYLLTGNGSYLAEVQRAHEAFVRRLSGMELGAEERELTLLRDVERDDAARMTAAADAIEQQRLGSTGQGLRAVLMQEGQPAHDALVRKLAELRAEGRDRVREKERTADFTTRRALLAMGGSTTLALVVAVATALAFARSRNLLREAWFALEGQVKEVERANRDLDAFAGTVAHDLSNALMPLHLAPSLIRRSVEHPENLGRIADRMETLARNASRLLDGLLAFSRAGRSEAGSAADIVFELGGVLEELSPLVAQVGARVQASSSPSWVRCSPALLHIVLLNLLSNALKFLESSPVREVKVHWLREAGQLRVSVQDTGPGIPDAELPRIFQAFYRSPGVTVAGTGLGLATVKRIVEAHGGGVSVRSPAAGGALFTFSLPLADAPSEGSHTSMSLGESPAPS